jgi:hypothetical protein
MIIINIIINVIIRFINVITSCDYVHTSFDCTDYLTGAFSENASLHAETIFFSQSAVTFA